MPRISDLRSRFSALLFGVRIGRKQLVYLCDVCCNIRNVKFIKVMHFKQMFVTAVCVLFLLKLKWPKSKNFYQTIHERYGHDTLKTVRKYEKISPGITKWHTMTVNSAVILMC